MTIPKSFGFPRMMHETGERRVFLPEFVQYIANFGVEVHIEEGYGSRSGYQFEDYQEGNPAIQLSSRELAFKQDMTMILRSPSREELAMMKPGSSLFAMLHFPTRPKRVTLLDDMNIRAISMDSIINDSGFRLVENMKAVAWNGLDAAFSVLEKHWPNCIPSTTQPIRVLIIGAGMVGRHAVEAATKLGNLERNVLHMEAGGPGCMAITVGRNISSNTKVMQSLMAQSDILVDASQRRDPSQPVIPNDWIRWLPDHTVIADLSVDPYTLDANPPVVRGVEGIPQGNLDQYIFFPDDPAWERSIPDVIPSKERRPVVSCYSWPGIHPEASMRHYGRQLLPLMDTLMECGYDNLSLEGNYFERALYRGTLRFWLEQASQYPVNDRRRI